MPWGGTTVIFRIFTYKETNPITWVITFLVSRGKTTASQMYWGFEWRKNMKNLAIFLAVIAFSMTTPVFAQEPSFDAAFKQHCSWIEDSEGNNTAALLEILIKQCEETYTRYKGDLLRSYYLETMTEKDTDIKYDSEIESFGHCPNQVIPDGQPGPGGLISPINGFKTETQTTDTREGTTIISTKISCEFIASCEPCLDKGDAVAISFIGLE